MTVIGELADSFQTPTSISTSISTTSTTSLPTFSTTTFPILEPSPTQSDVSHSRPSTGALAAIGASIGGVGLIAGLILAFIIYKRQKGPVANPSGASSQAAEVTPREAYLRQNVVELEVPVAELHGHYSAAELPGYWRRT